MAHEQPFLTAQWRHLAMLNFEIDPNVLRPLVPVGTELDWLAAARAGASIGSHVVVFKGVRLNR